MKIKKKFTKNKNILKAFFLLKKIIYFYRKKYNSSILE